MAEVSDALAAMVLLVDAMEDGKRSVGVYKF